MTTLTKVVLLILCLSSEGFVCGQSEKRDALAAVKWNTDGYEIALWELYHAYENSRGHPWEDFARLFDINDLQEIATWQSQYLVSHQYRINRKALKSVQPANEMRLTVTLEKATNLIMSVDPSIRFDFGKEVGIEELEALFEGNTVVDRTVRLHSLRREIKLGRLVRSIDVTFQHFENHNINWNCNGFYIEVSVTPKEKEPDTMHYYVGSGLDPFRTRSGQERPLAFGPQNILIDPEFGTDCEEEDNGARVFVRWP